MCILVYRFVAREPGGIPLSGVYLFKIDKMFHDENNGLKVKFDIDFQHRSSPRECTQVQTTKLTSTPRRGPPASCALRALIKMT